MSQKLEIYQKFLDMDTDERNAYAKQTLDLMHKYLYQYYEEKVIVSYVISIFSVFSCADDTVNMAEYELFKYVTGARVSYDDFYETVKSGTSEELIEELYELLASESEEFIEYVLVLVICIYSCDGTITVEEQEFVDNFFGALRSNY